ncbi:MAG: GDSL-type esterase/lipase family protein [Saccharofermentans sp.]|nr:GDSL-type esterase/lipase family protein [Saccharofermentans sp.]
MGNYTKWVAAWGNATSIIDQTACTYAKDITLRYPVKMCFNGNKIRVRFSNISGTEAVTIKASIANGEGGKKQLSSTSSKLTLNGDENIVIEPGQEVTTDEINYDVTRGQMLSVNIYLPTYTQMNSGVLITGPLSEGYYSYGNHMNEDELPMDLTRKTNWFYFLNTIDVFTEETNKALICFGDSITAQSWPDYLTLRLEEMGITNLSVIRRAISGTRILREYSCITYAAYGIKGETRFPVEVNTAGASAVIIQHGINDIIHPVGVDVNPFRPWEDMPTVESMAKGVEDYYVAKARALGLKVYGGTLLPIYGWRTYADFRDEIRVGFNDWIRSSSLFDGVVDFDNAVKDRADARKFAEGFDSGDHLHPSESAYKAMAECVPEEFLRQ